MTKRKSDFTLPTLDDLFTTQAERDDAKLERVKNIPLAGIVLSILQKSLAVHFGSN